MIRHLYVRLKNIEADGEGYKVEPHYGTIYRSNGRSLLNQLYPEKELHVSRKVREKYNFDEVLFSITGNVIFANFGASRLFAQKMNEKRDLVRFPELAVKAGEINAVGLIDEIFHYVIHLYREQTGFSFELMLDSLNKKLGKDKVDHALYIFTEQFPPMEVHRKEIAAEKYLVGETEGVPNKEIVLEEMLLLWLSNINPAFLPFRELFDDTYLNYNSVYKQITEFFKPFFETQPHFGPGNQNLIDMLRSPMEAEPNSLPGQLRYMREQWGMLLGKFLFRLLKGLDFIKEELKFRAIGPGPTTAYKYLHLEEEAERFSMDRDWMPHVVMIAKNAFVWMDQLSKKYGCSVNSLKDIPDEELDILARRGFSALWLIGLWERSKASKRIKQITGNPEAEASAYALNDYEIARDLGGWETFHDLKERCRQRGIRLASDMVPNHTGIDSRWVIQHPDWFVQLPYPPFPRYTYTGENLSSDDRVGIYIEDHYYDRTDAAVTFKRVDFYTGDTRYIYHGNDGTSMPWNDTAQLNFLKQEVREAVINTILHVARNFPIIRFDAAMTLTKKHYQRLWFPEPGSGGDIPSRAEYGKTRAEFEREMPVEFWREVVDRVSAEAPDTLLLAEAFWMMEGYFVRTLGMHRVYNSAFMNMLRNEENAKYRQTIKNTLEFDPEILKRFVNFMNNPDEETAVAQFGKGDKYFGICTMMVTMPGLPMFGHGQVEGFAEKYGMEYRRAYWDEIEDIDLINRHEREIFPLMKKRYLYSEVKNFLLYDLYTPDGTVNENVFAYSNRAYSEASLVIYNNSYSEAKGWIKTSAGRVEKNEEGRKAVRQKTLAEGLNLKNDPQYYCVLREQRSGLCYLRKSSMLNKEGLYVELKGYECQVFTDIYEVQDDQFGSFSKLAEELNGRGVSSLDEALKAIYLRPIIDAFSRFVNIGEFNFIRDALREEKNVAPEYTEFIKTKYLNFLEKTGEYSGSGLPKKERFLLYAESMKHNLEALLNLPALLKQLDISSEKSSPLRAGMGFLHRGFSITPEAPFVLAGYVFCKSYGDWQIENIVEEWQIDKHLCSVFMEGGLEQNHAERSVLLLKTLLTHSRKLDKLCDPELDSFETALFILQHIFRDEEARIFLGENRYKGVLFFNKEAFRDLVWFLFAVAVIEITGERKKEPGRETERGISHAFEILKIWYRAEEASGYRVESLFSELERKTGKSRS